MSRRQLIKANVVLPKDISREKYVEYCLRTHSVSVMSEHGEFMKNCPVVYNFCGVNEGFFYSLDIPKTSQDIGSRVLVAYLKEQEMGIILGCLPDGKNIKLDEEFQMKFIRRTEGNSFAIKGSGMRGVVDILAQGNKTGNGKLNFKSFNGNDTAEINFATDYLYQKVKNTIKFTSNKIISLAIQNKVLQDEYSFLNWELGVGFILSDEFGNNLTIDNDGFTLTGKDGGEFKITGGELRLNGNTYSVPLGEKLTTELNKERLRLTTLFAAISGAPIVATDGGASFKAALVLAISPLVAGDFSSVLSNKVKLD